MNCESLCLGGYCINFKCIVGENCIQNCKFNCINMRCKVKECDQICIKGNCKMYCELGLDMCIMFCFGGNCLFYCDGIKCKCDCFGGGCEMFGFGKEVMILRLIIFVIIKLSGNVLGFMLVVLVLFVFGIVYIFFVYEY